MSTRSGTTSPEVWTARLNEILPVVASRFVDLAREAARHPERRVDEDGWTVDETIRHVLTHFWRNTWDSRTYGEDVTESEMNAVAIEETRRQPLDAVIEDIARLSDALYTVVWPAVPPNATFAFHLGSRISLPARQANSLRELLLHGWDIAAASALEWPIPKDDAAAVTPVFEMIPVLYPPTGVDAVFAIAVGTDVVGWFDLGEDATRFEARIGATPPDMAIRPDEVEWLLSAVSTRADVPRELVPFWSAVGRDLAD